MNNELHTSIKTFMGCGPYLFIFLAFLIKKVQILFSMRRELIGKTHSKLHHSKMSIPEIDWKNIMNTLKTWNLVPQLGLQSIKSNLRNAPETILDTK